MPPPVEEERLLGARCVDAALLSGVNGRGVCGARMAAAASAASEGLTMCLTDCLTDTGGRFPPWKPRVSIWRECSPGLRPAHSKDSQTRSAKWKTVRNDVRFRAAACAIAEDPQWKTVRQSDLKCWRQMPLVRAMVRQSDIPCVRLVCCATIPTSDDCLQGYQGAGKITRLLWSHSLTDAYLCQTSWCCWQL